MEGLGTGGDGRYDGPWEGDGTNGEMRKTFMFHEPQPQSWRVRDFHAE